MSPLQRAAPWIEAALYAEDARPLWTMGDVIRDLDERRAHLWMGERAAMVTTISDYPAAGERLIECWLAGGDMKELKAMTPQVEEWARHVGCTQAHVTGRAGWARALKPLGYEHYATTVRKLLT